MTRKRTSLKTKITLLTKAVADGKIDRSNALLRLERLTELYKEYELLSEELVVVDVENIELTHTQAIEDKYYEIATRIRSLPVPGGSGHISTAGNITNFGSPAGNSTIVERQRFIKLPITSLPRFDGDYNKWLSFKNTFLSMIDARSDVDELNKFLYLKGCLDGPALNKLALYDASTENYKKAWDTLVSEYEKVRILIAKHYDSLMDIPSLSDATSKGLTRIVDDARQHLSMLNSLQVNVDEGMVVRMLERKLPIDVRTKWEETLSLDVFPSLTQLYKFISETAFRISMTENKDIFFRDGVIKRKADQNPNYSKVRKIGSNVRSLVTVTQNTCGYCNENHLIYQCVAFEKLSINDRWNAVKRSQLCKNCLRSHLGKCMRSHCKRCNRYHNTLLHSDAPGKFKPGNNSSTVQARTVENVPAQGGQQL